MAFAGLTLTPPWIPKLDVDELSIRHGSVNALDYDDGIVLEVTLLEPERFDSPEDLIEQFRGAESRPGRVALVAGKVPPQWRARLRANRVSWLDVSRVLEIHWPRIEIVAEDYPVNPGVRSRLPLGLARGRAAVVQALCHVALENQPAPTVSELAARASVSPSTTSRTIGDLVEHGLVSKPDRYGPVVVFDTAALARLLAERTSWRRAPVVLGYFWGASSFDVAARFSVEAERAQVGSAITGRVGASLFGILGAGNPEQVRVRVKCEPKQLTDVCRRLQVERVVREEANIAVAADPWGLGEQDAEQSDLNGVRARLASPLRIWCDIADEPRGTEFAAQLWGMMTSDR